MPSLASIFPLQPNDLPASPILEHQLGVFKLPLDLIQSNPAACLQLFAHVVVMEAGLRLNEGCVQYLGYSEHFEPLALGAVAPAYVAVFAAKGKGKFLGFTMHNAAGAPVERRKAAVVEGLQA